MPKIPRYKGTERELNFLVNNGKHIMQLISSENAVGNKEMERALRNYALNKKITKGVSAGTVSNHIGKLREWGLVQEEKDPLKIAEMDLRRREAGKLTSNRHPQIRHILTGNGKILLHVMTEFQDRSVEEQLEAVEKQMMAFQECNLLDIERDHLIALVKDVNGRLERKEDATPSLRAIYDLGARLEERGIVKWFDVNELRNLWIVLPSLVASTKAKVEGLRILQLVMRSHSYSFMAGYQTQLLTDNIINLIKDSNDDSGHEAFLTYTRMRDKGGKIMDEQVNLFLDVLWRCHTPFFNDRITDTEAVFQVAREWKRALTEKQKEKIRMSIGHLRARDTEIFKNNIDSGDHDNEEREIDAERYRVTLAQLSSYV